MKMKEDWEEIGITYKFDGTGKGAGIVPEGSSGLGENKMELTQSLDWGWYPLHSPPTPLSTNAYRR